MKLKLSIFLFVVSNIFFGQEKQILKNIKIVYSHSLMKDVFLNDYTLIIKDSIAQYNSNREKQKKEINGNTFEIGADIFINNLNLNTNLYKEQRKLESSTLVNSEWFNETKWEITNETKFISGYKAIKATTESYELKKDNPYYQGKAIVWFTMEIPISAGPARYGGLPGLILEIEYEKGNSKYRLKSIVLDTSESLKDINDGKKIIKSDILYWR